MTQTVLKSQQAFGGDGWQPANETWAYASASTITVPSGAASKYTVGDRLKFTQHSAVKYAVIITVADTLLTILTNTDYVVENTSTYPITLNYYSHEASPIGYPQIFNIATPTWDVTKFDNGSGGQPTTNAYKVSITGRTLTGFIRASGTKAGTGLWIYWAHGLPTPATSTGVGIGTAEVAGAVFIGAICQYYESGNFWIMANTNTDDNQAINVGVTFTFLI